MNRQTDVLWRYTQSIKTKRNKKEKKDIHQHTKKRNMKYRQKRIWFKKYYLYQRGSSCDKQFSEFILAKPFQYDWSWEKYGFKWVCPGTATPDCSISFEWFRIQYLVLKPEFFIEAKGSSFHTFRQNALAEPSVQLPHFRSV